MKWFRISGGRPAPVQVWTKCEGKLRIAQVLPGQKMTAHELARGHGLDPETVWIRIDGRKTPLGDAEFTLKLVGEKGSPADPVEMGGRTAKIRREGIGAVIEAFTVLNIPKVAVAALSLDKTLLAGLEIEPGALTAGAYEGVLLLLVARFIYRVRDYLEVKSEMRTVYDETIRELNRINVEKRSKSAD